MSASGINWRRNRDYFTRNRICHCDPTSGDECRWCSGDTYSSELAAIAAAVAAVTQREQERRAS